MCHHNVQVLERSCKFNANQIDSFEIEIPKGVLHNELPIEMLRKLDA